ALRGRSLDFTLPERANFRDRIAPHELNPATFTPGQQVARYPEECTFLGYRRPGSRGVGTRNVVVILGATSSTASFVRAVAHGLQPLVEDFSNIDGIVPIAHTEGSGYTALNNRDLLLRTLAGIMVHSNVAAVLAVDLASDPINNQQLRDFLHMHNYPLDAVLHDFFSLTGDWQADLTDCTDLITEWLPQANTFTRTPESLCHLNVATQCGGSDAFSGVSGNPLASEMTKAVVRYGGRANFAETDELIGSEAYILQNIRDLPTAQKFLDFVELFKERLSWHGQSAEGNPSGGNKLRGLYNIALKSLGAALKRHPDVRIDQVVDYGERMIEPGFYFMNSPGNDLESIAGQVAAGSNLIIFITGNGSITNFPFVPTIKVMTTTARYELLAAEMDINAGRYLDGVPMAALTRESVDLLVAIASGQQSCGELAGHSQISIWRNWQQTDRSRLPLILERAKPTGQPIAVETGAGEIRETETGDRETRDKETGGLPTVRPRVNLILPTSLCSGQIARLAVAQLTQRDPATSYATLVHTEGCGVAFASTRAVYAETMVGYADHPLVARTLFLEHGCEKAHNDYLRSLLIDAGLDPAAFGWASVQLDGGIQKVLAKVQAYFQQTAANGASSGRRRPATIALLADGRVPNRVAGALAQVAQGILASGGSVVAPDQNELTLAPVFRESLLRSAIVAPSLAYGQAIAAPGFHVMETPTAHWTETVTGLGATGAAVILAYTAQPRPGHPLVPVLTVAERAAQRPPDLWLRGHPDLWPAQIYKRLTTTLAGRYQPLAFAQNNVDFQLTRGWLGIST
ncbi:MAG: UxaA family hydrolase, partial [Caldilineaceae bacterium]|nr:UxaA family hydrolase [Caldilineaceae bacterium]